MLFDHTPRTTEDEQPWAVCTSKKWAKVDFEAYRELYAKYGKERVLEVLRDYASALTGNAKGLPELKNPRSLLWGWREINAALAKCVEATPMAYRIAAAEGKPTLVRTIEMSLRARARWHQAVVKADLSIVLNTTPTLAESLLEYYWANMAPPHEYVCGWVKRTEEPWSHKHPWHTLDGQKMALEHVGDPGVWFAVVAYVERYFAG